MSKKYLIIYTIICFSLVFITGCAISKEAKTEDNMAYDYSDDDYTKTEELSNADFEYIEADFDGEGDDAWEDGTSGTDFYDKESGAFELYNYRTGEALIKLKIPEAFSVSYADEDGTAYTLINENYDVISVYGTASQYAQSYLETGNIPYNDYKCEITAFPVAGYDSMLVSETYTDEDNHKFEYNYFWIPYIDQDGNNQYIQFTISNDYIKSLTVKDLEKLFTEILVL